MIRYLLRGTGQAGASQQPFFELGGRQPAIRLAFQDPVIDVSLVVENLLRIEP
jgi:hypothetical protein